MMLLYFVLILFALYLIPMSNKKKKKKNPYTIYGTMGCGWTRKQLNHMREKKLPHRFVDCSKESCPKFDGFPAIKHPNGNTTIGYLIM